MTEYSTLTVPDGGAAVALRVLDTGGTGSPVVLIHPWPQRIEIWEHQIAALTKAGHRVVAYDRAGFGESDAPNDGVYDYDRLMQHLNGIIEALDLTNVTLVGWSMGGGEVARYVGTHGTDRLRGVVFLASATPYLLHTDDNPGGPVTDEAWRGDNAAIRDDVAAVVDGVATNFFSVDGRLLVDQATLEQAQAWAHTARQEAVAGCQEAFSTTDFRADVAAVDVPGLVIHGDSDAIVPFEYSGERTHAMLDGSSLVLVPGAPHGLGVTHADQVNNALIAFIEGLPHA
ncbi:MAG: alpha/beta fold hydrolase [Galactobacter sp.]